MTTVNTSEETMVNKTSSSGRPSAVELHIPRTTSTSKSNSEMDMIIKAKPTSDLAHALKQCQAAAQRGYDIAKENLRESAKAIDGISKSLLQCLKTLEDGRVRTPGIVEQLKAQLADVASELEKLKYTTNLALEERRKRLDRFSITLFGRTMAGKSTLMEILTNGDGRSIGTGAQRTTRDIRTYTWNGLEITDVPGVAAFEGAEDEELAFKAASQADLVIFLITDDAPQPVEAECLARIRRLGKPVLGICNVKVAIDDDDDLQLFLRNVDRHFDLTRLDQLIKQFHAFADQYIPGMRVPFIVSHLRSRFLAQQPQYARVRDQLLMASRFDEVESRIVSEVVGRGTFLRVKSFIDGAVVPIMDLMDQLLEFSARNSSAGRVLIDKHRRLREWSQAFRKHGQERINTLVSKVMDKLRDEVPSFVEDHYEDSSAGKSWKRLVEATGINRKVEKLQKELLDECKKALSEVARELKSELSLVASLSADRHITMHPIFDSKRVCNWGTNILAGGLGIAALILGSGPLGWAAAAVGAIGLLISLFLDDREEKARRAREKLTRRLLADIDKMERKLRKSLEDWFHQELLGKQVYVLLNDLKAVSSGLFALADAQRTLAWTLNDRQKALGRMLIEEALVQLETENLKHSIVEIARVPGMATMLVIAPNTTFPGEVRHILERLLGEKIWFVVDTKNRFSILVQAIGRDCDRKKINIEEKIHVAHVPLDELGPMTRARVKLAQQLTGLHVMR